VQYGAVQRRSTQYSAVQHAMLLPTCSPPVGPTPVVQSSTRTMPNDLGMDHTEWIWDAGTGVCSMYSSAIPPR
jgi:hypothetical protein